MLNSSQVKLPLLMEVNAGVSIKSTQMQTLTKSLEDDSEPME